MNTPPEVVSEVEDVAESAPEASEAEATPVTDEAAQAEA